MKLRWSDDAIADRNRIWAYVENVNPSASLRLDQQLSQAATRLEQFPEIGRTGELPGTRELLAHSHYKLVYEIRADEVWIVSVVHTSRQWPPVPDDGDLT